MRLDEALLGGVSQWYVYPLQNGDQWYVYPPPPSPLL